ncbi:MAG: D-hexose-6-phosphate mutarotase [Endozoicomonas sp.]
MLETLSMPMPIAKQLSITKQHSKLGSFISLCSLNELPVLQIRHPKAEAAISLHGGHLIQFRPTGEKDVIWLSDKAFFRKDKAIRGGVPVCWPWFGPLASPSHGFARISQWQLLDHQENEQEVVIRIILQSSPETRDIWPHDFSATLTFTISDTLSIDLEVTNTDLHPWQWSGALHTYFNIAEAAATRITGMGDDYLDSLKGNQPSNSSEPLLINQSIDRVYTAPSTRTRIHDNFNLRTIVVNNSGHNSVVIWNPWEEISATMTDMNDHGYNTMVCVEATRFANALDECPVLNPGQSHRLGTHISVSPPADT